MHESELQFATEFLRTHPDDAADVLELQPSSLNAALLERLSQAQARTLLTAMLPLHAARTLAHLDGKQVIRILAGLKANQIVAILRYIETKTVEAWLKGLPLDLSTTCRLLLDYSTTMVGAWMIPKVMMLGIETSAGEALLRIPREDSHIDTDAIYIVDKERVPQGVISVFNLLKAKKETPLARLMDPQTYAVSGRASLVSVKQHDGWNHRDTLPVLNRRRQLIGVLRHADLRKGLERDVSYGNGLKMRLPVTELYNTYSNVLVALFNVVNDVTGNR